MPRKRRAGPTRVPLPEGERLLALLRGDHAFQILDGELPWSDEQLRPAWRAHREEVLATWDSPNPPYGWKFENKPWIGTMFDATLNQVYR